MVNTGIKPKVVEEIRQIAKHYHVQKVILFGSRARGDYQWGSDIDLAVKGGDFDAFAVDVKKETSTLLDFDVINLNQTVQEKLLQSICKEGVVLYEEV